MKDDREKSVINWNVLKHAYGGAADVPNLLDALSSDAKDPVWDELWGRVCHQGTVYSASAPVLPFLLAAARGWPPTARVMPLSLAGAIAISQDASGEHDLQPYQATIEALRALAADTAACVDLTPIDFIYVLQASRALEGDVLWGQLLDRLASGEFEGTCTSCASHLRIAIGEYGFFAASEEWVNRPSTLRIPLRPASEDDLHGVSALLYRQACAALQSSTADWLRYLFGFGICPACNRSFSVAGAIAATA
ncbi:hypothetical protein SAMN05518800_1854 [Variovorax sp. YR752]|uniref:hypothetical protein n=1 Tax=Variovorax sp. YR752 TaxID=1884383 RepID=UPI000BD2EBD8|nr:hypothetical protein [Variovorax sp. YR752]SOD25329.1 hypothetical protein SAMN05518800_1854 [Variovorax sp. YR752]